MVNLNYFFPSVAEKIPNIEKLEGKKVLVTGASGLIGNHILSTLADVGAEISIIQNKTQPFAFYKGCKYYSWDSLKQSIKFEYIFHLAGYGQPKKFSSKKFDTIALNTRMLGWLLLNLKEGGSILFASTSEIYSGLTVEATEDMIGTTTPEHPRACYIEGKRCGETIIHALNELDFNGKIARIALSYGPGVRYEDTRVMSDFIKMALETGEIKPKGGLYNIRTYCYVTDTVTMLFNILLNGKHTVYNVAGDSKTNILDLALKIADISQTKASWSIDYKEDKSSAPKAVKIDISRYKSEFGNPVKTGFTEGLAKTIEWFKYLKGD